MPSETNPTVADRIIRNCTGDRLRGLVEDSGSNSRDDERNIATVITPPDSREAVFSIEIAALKYTYQI
jgi:hypothetical protein